MSSCALILNYNDCSNTMELAKTLESYRSIEGIIIVDNCSTDCSTIYLKQLADSSEKIDLIKASTNRGYAAGNNIGLRYLIEHNSCSHVLIANPDVRVDESAIEALSSILEKHQDCVICGCKQLNPITRKAVRSYWDLPTFAYDWRALFLLGRRYNRHFHEDDLNDFDGESYRVGAVSGAMFMADLERLGKVGLFDEGTFLYCEEVILGRRCDLHDMQVRYLPIVSYQHYHGASTKKALGFTRSMKLLHESMLYYHQTYDGLSAASITLFRTCMFLSRIEFFLISLAIMCRDASKSNLEATSWM